MGIYSKFVSVQRDYMSEETYEELHHGHHQFEPSTI